MDEKDKIEAFKHWAKTKENSYLGSNYGKPDTENQTLLVDRCVIDLPFLTLDEIKKLVIMLN